jgi:serine phosphatase RsbU (regulator of sigma subunit)
MTESLPRARILVVDDDPAMLHAVSRVLGRQHQVASAQSPILALNQARTFRPDVAIVDIRMPEMNGFDLMRKLCADLPDLDIILMTGNAEEPEANLIRAIDEGAFYFIQKPFQRRVLLALVARCLELRQLREEKSQHLQLLQNELEEAREFQMSLLPPQESQLHGVSISARYVPCNELAGDFYDYVEAPNEAIALVLADVVGHGASAAMLTSIVKSAFHAASVDGFDPLSVVDRVKENVRAFDPGRFVTLISARLDTKSGKLTYANAGHPFPIVRRPGKKPLLLESTGTIISSALCDVPCDKRVVPLDRDDFVLFYTDGVSESQGKHGMFGRAGIVRLLGRSRSPGPEFLEELIAAVSRFRGGQPHQDDITMLAIEFV